MSVQYECDTGYRGAPIMVCGEDGVWRKSPASASCRMVGCGSLDYWLKVNIGSSWARQMTIVGEHNMRYSFAGEVVPFQCHQGFHGKPVARCIRSPEQGHRNKDKGEWSMTNQCQRFATARGSYV